MMFVFGKEKIDADHCCQSFQNCITEKDCKILMVYDVVYHHAIGRVQDIEIQTDICLHFFKFVLLLT